MNETSGKKGHEVRNYVIGYLASLALTGAAFAAVRWPIVGGGAILAAVFVLALAQMVVHFRFFLHIRLGKSSREDLQLILFSVLIIAMMVAGTLVILWNLKHRMM